jgi:SAM-dependent methyltransferase
MNDEYLKLKDFWNNHFKDSKSDEVLGKWVEDENFNRTVKKYIKEGSKVLDFGSGRGWGLIELAYTVNIEEGIGIDQSINAVNTCNQTIEASKIKNLKFIVGDENTLDNYIDYFDAVLTVNTFDVITDEALENVILSCKKVLKNDGYLLVSINPDFPLSFFEEKGFQIKNDCIYRDNIFRSNNKTNDEWIEYLSQHFEFIEFVTFALSEMEKTYPRRMFVFKKV